MKTNTNHDFIDDAKMLDLLLRSDPGNLKWWMQLLMGETPTSPVNANA